MAEEKKRKYDLGGRKVELPDGSTFEFAWDMDVYPIARELIEEDGMSKDIFDAAQEDVIGLAKMLEAWRELNTSKLTTALAILWEMHHRLDSLLHAFTVTVRASDFGTTGAEIALENIARVRDRARMAREHCDLGLEGGRISKINAMLDALLGDD